MDAHSFRILAKLLAPLLDGARIDKIYGPLPDLTVFHCFGKRGKFSFAVQTQKQQPRYFIQSAPLPNPATPAPQIMRLRKYLVNAHFGMAVVEMASRTLALPVTRHGETLCWLLCSPSRGVILRSELPENFPLPLAWPDESLLEKLLTPESMGGQSPDKSLKAPSEQESHLPNEPTELLPKQLPKQLPDCPSASSANCSASSPANCSANSSANGSPRHSPGHSTDFLPKEASNQVGQKPLGPLEDPATWLAYPVLTPLLRKTLAALDKPEALALMVDLEAGGDELFFYGPAKEQPTCYYAWPLPDALCEEAGLVPIAADYHPPTRSSTRAPESAGAGEEAGERATDGATAIPRDLALASFIDEQSLHGMFSEHLHKDDKQSAKRDRKRLRRKERALEQEALRLETMVNRQKDACLIQENLWRLDPEAKYDNITLTSTLPTGETETRTIALDPGLSIRDNMLEIFKKAEKGKRGLAILATRRREILPRDEQPATAGRLTTDTAYTDTAYTDTPLHMAEPKVSSEWPEGGEAQEALPRTYVKTTPKKTPVPIDGSNEASLSSPWHNLLEQPGKHTQKNVAVFRSSDGYTILRGKNAQGNRQILKLGKPHDMWLHVQDGPSAHAIIKRDHAQDTVPESTIIEAAQLVAEKSWLKENDSAEVMLALVKNVQNIKGASAGTVKVDKVFQTIYIKRVSV